MDKVPDDGIERFKCCDCDQWIPVVYRVQLEGDGRAYFGGDAICDMCWRYWEYIDDAARRQMFALAEERS